MVDQFSKSARLLGRAYLLAIIPFFGGAIAPWILGPQANNEIPAFIFWSFTVLIFCSAGWLGIKAGAGEKFIVLHALIALLISAAAVAAFLVAQKSAPFMAVALLTFLHWLHLLWLQKTSHVAKELLRQHQRFVWTFLACHMVVLLNLIYAVKTAG